MIDINFLASRFGWAPGRRGKITNPVAELFLRRPFSRRSEVRRIQLIYVEDELANPMFTGFLRDTQRMRAAGLEFRAVSYPTFKRQPSRYHADAIFIQAPYFIDRDELGLQLQALRTLNPESIISFFDWFAPPDIRFAACADPWVDYYVKKSLYADRQIYLEAEGGHSLLTDYYSDRFGTENPRRDWIVPQSIIPKLRVAPAFHTSYSLVDCFEGCGSLTFDGREIDLHARLQTRGQGWYSAMRMEAKAKVDALGKRMKIASEGRISRSEFMREMHQSKICFSPFGYGEICWRDYEAVAAGAVLLKPDMSHIETAPDIFRPMETYMPVRWDLADLDEKVALLLEDDALRERLALNAFEVLHQHVQGDDVAHLALGLSDKAQFPVARAEQN